MLSFNWKQHFTLFSKFLIKYCKFLIKLILKDEILNFKLIFCIPCKRVYDNLQWGIWGPTV